MVFSNEAISYQEKYFQRLLLFKTNFINPLKNNFLVLYQFFSFLAEQRHSCNSDALGLFFYCHEDCHFT